MRHTAALELSAPAYSGPPKYTPDVTPVPDYSAQPRSDERTMLSSQRPRVPRPSEPTPYLYEYLATDERGDFRLVLAECRTELVEMGIDGVECDVPVFARNSVIRGTVVLSNEPDTRGIVSVSVHAAGRITLAIDAPGPSARLPAHIERVLPVLSHSVVLFSAPSPETELDSGTVESTERCPQTMRFELALPPNYKDRRQHVRPLPPSYAARISGGPTVGDLWAEVSYSVEVAIVRQTPLGLQRQVVVGTPFMYRPRTRPLRPQPFVYPHSDILDVVKIAPHLWELYTTLLKNGKTVRSEVLLPQSRAFCLSGPIGVDDGVHTWGGTIPLRVQLHEEDVGANAEAAACTPVTTDELGRRPNLSLLTPPPSPFGVRPSDESQPASPLSLTPPSSPSTLSLAQRRSVPATIGQWLGRSLGRLLSTPPASPTTHSALSPPPTPTNSVHSTRPSTPVIRATPATLPIPIPTTPNRPSHPRTPSSASFAANIVEETVSRLNRDTPPGTPQAYLVRRLNLDVCGRVGAGVYVCGEAFLRPSVDGGWEGAVQLDAAELQYTHGFQAPGVSLEDFVVVSWGLDVGVHCIPVRLVTDPHWIADSA